MISRHNNSTAIGCEEPAMSSGQLVEHLKAEGQDFEFYPTTNEIIARLLTDLRRIKHAAEEGRRRDDLNVTSFLDIGAGHGKVIRAVKEAHYNWCDRDDEQRSLCSEFYAIEKSIPLLELLDDDVFVVGTDFHEQSLVAKQVDVTFSNPPYSEFEEWATKIIRESSSKIVYLVIPTRWADSGGIKQALEYREAKTKILGEFTFQHAEDRQARAVVNLLRIDLAQEQDDSFNRFFDAQFAELKAKFAGTQTESSGKDEGKVKHEGQDRFGSLVVGQNYPERLVELYNAELDHIRKNYDLVAKLDADLLKEFDVTPERILGCLKARLAGLRNLYWKELFDNMDSVTNRLTSKKRRVMLEKLNASGHVDFTLGNIHAIIIWVLKNANAYLDAQLVETFEKMASLANVKCYVSNQRAFEQNDFRYAQAKPTHIALEFRMVLEYCGGIETGYSGQKLNESGCDFLGDLLTVARNLGFECKTGDARLQRWGGGAESTKWKSGKAENFYTTGREHKVGDRIEWDGVKKITGKVKLDDGKFQYEIGGAWVHERCLPGEVLFEAKAYLNGNVHLRLNQKFALALNVEYGRLRGWLKTGAEAAAELNDKEAPLYFGKQVQLGAHSLLMLSGPPAAPIAAPPPGTSAELDLGDSKGVAA